MTYTFTNKKDKSRYAFPNTLSEEILPAVRWTRTAKRILQEKLPLLEFW